MTDATESTRNAAREALMSFFRDDFASPERRDLWAEDAVFEMPFATGGRMVIRGREAIYERAKLSYSKFESFRFTDVKIFPTSDPETYFVTCGSESVPKSTQMLQADEYVNIFRVKNGKVLHRTEYFNPMTHPR
jgi:ketosteroid isomerase-like protein